MTLDDLAAIRARAEANGCQDAIDLLAEVNRLRADAAHWGTFGAEALAVAAERARIRAAVEGLFHGNYSWAEVTWDEALPAVLAVIDGEPT